jgi:hypothetical protein
MVHGVDETIILIFVNPLTVMIAYMHTKKNVIYNYKLHFTRLTNFAQSFSIRQIVEFHPFLVFRVFL